MAKKPILTEDDLDGGAPVPPITAVPPLPPGLSPEAPPGATRPIAASASPAPTRPVDPGDVEGLGDAGAGGRDASGHARPRTRILGYGTTAPVETPEVARVAASAEPDAAPLPAAPLPAGKTEATAPVPVGWLVVTAGPGRGTALSLISGMNAVGRGDGCHIQLDFGDDSISRDAHAYVTYDDETRGFFVSHGGKTNLVRLNNAPVLAAQPLNTGDTLRIGSTSLRFVALCGADFDWSAP